MTYVVHDTGRRNWDLKRANCPPPRLTFNDMAEDPFALIEEGNRLEEEGKFWEAAEAFGRAFLALDELSSATRSKASEQRAVCTTSDNKDDFRKRIKKAVEMEKIAALYKNQGMGYKNRAKGCVMSAIKEEVPGEGIELAEDILTKRRVIFQSLYACLGDLVSSPEPKEQQEERESNEMDLSADEPESLFDIPVAPVASNVDVEKKTADVYDLEARLANINSTIPSNLKTEDERMADIQKSVKGLGGYVMPISDDIKRHTIKHEKPTTQEEQIKQIIEQAKDEVRLEDGRNIDKRDENINKCVANIGVDEGNSLQINDEDDLAAVLEKSHLLGMSGRSIAENFKLSVRAQEGDNGNLADEVSDLSKRNNLLKRISLAQEMLFEASAYLEEDSESSSASENSEDEEDDEDLGHQSLANAIGKVLLKQENGKVLLKQKQKRPGIEKGKACVIEAKTRIEHILKSWPME